MKKLLILIIIFLFSAAMIFAQGFVFFGDVSSGLWAHFNDKEDGDPYIQVAGNDAVPVRINFRGIYDNTDRNFGFEFNLRGQARNTAAANDKPRLDPNRNRNLNDILYFERVTAYLKMLKGLVTVTGGYWDPQDWETPGGLSTDLTMEGAGLIVDVSPIPNLNLMVSGWAKEGDTTLLGEARYIFTGIYQMPGIFKAIAHFASRPYGPLGYSKDDERNNYGGGTNEDPVSSYDEIKAKDQRLALGITYLGWQKFGFRRFGFDTRMYNLGMGKSANWDGTRMIIITPFFTGQRITWNWKNLELDGRFYQRFNIGDDGWYYGPALRFRLTAQYVFNDTPLKCDITPKLGYNLFINSNPWGDNPVDMRFDEAVISWENCDRWQGGWGIRPAVELRFGKNGNALFELGYSLKVNTGKPDDTILITEKSRVNHAVYTFIKIGVGRVEASDNSN